MQNKTIEEIEKEYDLELDKIIKKIKKENIKRVLLQFPEGLKPYSTTILEEIEKKTGANCFIWIDTCFGACDLPIETEKLGIQLIIQFGHSVWNYKDKKIKVIK
jgi:2-(3-amino-3-carboxypropyl)histidine synthase